MVKSLQACLEQISKTELKSLTDKEILLLYRVLLEEGRESLITKLKSYTS